MIKVNIPSFRKVDYEHERSYTVSFVSVYVGLPYREEQLVIITKIGITIVSQKQQFQEAKVRRIFVFRNERSRQRKFKSAK